MFVCHVGLVTFPSARVIHSSVYKVKARWVGWVGWVVIHSSVTY